MNGIKIERYLKQVLISLIIGGVCSALIYGIHKNTGVLIEIGSVISKSLSLISALVIGFLLKRYVDLQDKIKDVELNNKAPSSVVSSFEAQKDDYFSASYKRPINIIYLATSVLIVLFDLVLPLSEIKSRVDVIYYILVDTGFTVFVVSFISFVSYEIIKRTEEARRVKRHFEKMSSMETERQSLIDSLNKKVREQRDVDKTSTSPLRENKEFDLRGYIDKLEKEDPKE